MYRGIETWHRFWYSKVHRRAREYERSHRLFASSTSSFQLDAQEHDEEDSTTHVHLHETEQQQQQQQLNHLDIKKNANENPTMIQTNEPFLAFDRPMNHVVSKEDSDAIGNLHFTASRLGFPHFPNEHVQDPGDTIREETKEEATTKAEILLSILRKRMSEREIAIVIRRLGKFVTVPTLNRKSVNSLFEILESKFGEEYADEYEQLKSFLNGSDDFLTTSSNEALPQQADGQDPSTLATSAADHSGSTSLAQFEPVTDTKYMAVVVYLCRLAVLHSLNLSQRIHDIPQRKTGLARIKSDLRKVLEIDGCQEYADFMNLDREDPESFDDEWEDLNTDDNFMDYKMILPEAEKLCSDITKLINPHEVGKVLSSMLTTVKTTKAHRKTLQEIVMEIRSILPEETHEAILDPLITFVSGGKASFEDYQQDSFDQAYRHHKQRQEAILRCLLDARMRVGHILVRDIDEEPNLIPPKVSDEKKLLVAATAWNIVSLLSDKQYHAFFNRFLTYKLSWRPNRRSFGETFLNDASRCLGPVYSEKIMPMLREVYTDLSVEMLTISRIRLQHTDRTIRQYASVARKDGAPLEQDDIFPVEKTAFYKNLPDDTSEDSIRRALRRVGRVKNVSLISEVIPGPPETHDTIVVDASKKKKKQKKQSSRSQKVYEADDDDEEGDDDLVEGFTTLSDATPKRKARKGAKFFVIASDEQTNNQCQVEFETESARNVALSSALRIFGVMIDSDKTGFSRAAFASSPENRNVVCIYKIPFCTSVDSVLTELREIISPHYDLDVSRNVPPGVFVVNGMIELRFNSYQEAAHIVHLASNYLETLPSQWVEDKSRSHEEMTEKVKYRPFEVTWGTEDRKSVV